MIKEALEFLRDELVQPETLEFAGRQYTSRPVHNIPDIKEPERLVVHTLTGLRDYVKAGIDSATMQDISPFLHVVGHDCVRLVSILFGDFDHQRAKLVEARTEKTLTNGFKFDTFMKIPEFIIGLQAFFAYTADNVKLLEFVSNIKSDQSQTYLDTGYSQEVTAKRATGSSLVQSVNVPNPVTLKPYRTFLEIDQPESSFVFRLRSGNESEPPLCGLFEASGGAWKLDAVLRIKDWLESEQIGLNIIA